MFHEKSSLGLWFDRIINALLEHYKCSNKTRQVLQHEFSDVIKGEKLPEPR